MRIAGKRKWVAFCLAIVFTVFLLPMTAFAGGADTFTVTYMTNAGIEIGQGQYAVGAANAFPEIGEFGTYFGSFISRVAQKGSVAVGLEDARWYLDADFTQKATFPDGQAGENYTVYCRFTTGLQVDEVTNMANNKPYSSVFGSFGPLLLVTWGAANGRNDQLDNTVAIFEREIEGSWQEVAESYHTTHDGVVWKNGIALQNLSDNGQYRLKCMRYTAKDNSGVTLFYDDAYDPQNGVYEVKVLPQELTITDVSAVNRPYDGTNEVELQGNYELHGILNSDDVTAVLGNGTIADADAGAQKPVTTAIGLDGAKAGNYVLKQPTDLTVDIAALSQEAPKQEEFSIQSESGIDKNDGKIDGLKKGMEYRAKGAQTWLAVGEDFSLENLAAGEYEVRYQGDTNHAASDSVILSVGRLADYAKVDEAIAQAEALNRGDYQDFSAVDAAVQSVLRGKFDSEQEQVDAMAKAIRDAIAGLKPAAGKSPEGSAPKTGDSNGVLWSALLLAAFACTTVALIKRKKEL